MIRHTIVAAAATLAMANGAAADQTFSWTGTYDGYFACDKLTDGAPSSFGRPWTIDIVQTGDRIDMTTRTLVDPEKGASTILYRGMVRDSPAGDAVSGYVESCEGTFAYQELVRIFPATTTGETFGFAADTVFVSREVPELEGKLVVQSCKWAMRRVSTEAPAFEPCP
ncbi:MAG: hypothetical protein GY798_18815 [Hyphomicrobiales bacterium]|nr:hypothetical protein [Hyphomicrobiales bacterium]